MSRSNKYKTVRRTIQPFSYYREGKLVTIKKPFKRRYHMKKRGSKKPRSEQIRHNKSEWVTTTGNFKGHTETWHVLTKKKKPLEKYHLWSDLAPFSEDELLEMAKENEIEISFNDTKSDIVYRLLDEAEKQRTKKLLIKFNKREILHFADYIGRHTIQRDYKTKADLIEFLSVNTHEHIIHDYETHRDRVKGFSNDKKFIIRLLGEKALTENRIKKLVGEEILKELQIENLIYLKYVDRKADRYYSLSIVGRNHTGDAFDHLYKNVQIPKYQSMEKEIPPEIINSVKQLAKTRREYSIGLDFERELKIPQQIVAIQGAESFTYHLGEDFEMFGHTHPNHIDPEPSNADLKNMKIGKPEFIVAGKSGKVIIMNIEDEAVYREWKKFPYQPSLLSLGKKADRDMFFAKTGVRIYPYKKGMKVTLIDDPTLEKGFPFFSGPSLVKIHESEVARPKELQKPLQKQEIQEKMVPKKKRAYTTKDEKTLARIHREYDWVAIGYLGKYKMTPEDRINQLKYQIKALEELKKDPKLSKKVINKELETKRKKLKSKLIIKRN